jgi:hypothetical protein
MAEQLLYGANVVAAFEQVRRERMPERVTADAFRHSCCLRRDRDGALHDAFVNMKAGWRTKPRIAADPPCGKHELPGPTLRRVRILANQREWQHDSTHTRREIPIMLPLDLSQVSHETIPGGAGKHRPPILLAFPSPDHYLVTVQIDILHAELEAFLQAKTRAIQTMYWRIQCVYASSVRRL